ncbi:MAG: DNA polymerase III subunit delta [Patescibacteria group bacterium]
MIIFIYGENDFKISQKTKELKDKFVKDVDPKGENIFFLDGGKIKLEDLSSKIGTSSLFSSKKMLIISNLIENKQKDFLKNFTIYINKNKLSESPDIFIFIENKIKNNKSDKLVKIKDGKELALNVNEKNLFESLKKEKYSQELKKYTNQELLAFVVNGFKKENLKIDNISAQKIISSNDSNPWAINNEIEKISSLKISDKEGRIVTKDDVEQNTSEKFQENIFALTDALSSPNPKNALTLLEEQYLSGLEPPYILSMILRQFKIIVQIKSALELNYSAQKMASELKLHPFVISKGINQARNFPKNKLIEINNKLIDIDLNSRKKDCNMKASLNILISSL